MQCPECKAGRLEPTELEKGLIGAGCQQCRGVLLSLINYRYWVDHHGKLTELSDDTGNQVGISEEPQEARLCPKCQKIMIKYRIGADTSHKLDLCGHCDEAWLDAGEWRLLRKMDLQEKLPTIFTEAWQRNIRKQRELENWHKHFSDLIGETDFEKVKNFKSWLDQHPKSSDIKHFLTAKLD